MKRDPPARWEEGPDLVEHAAGVGDLDETDVPVGVRGDAGEVLEHQPNGKWVLGEEGSKG